MKFKVFFDYTLKGHHQCTKFIEEINDHHRKRTSKKFLNYVHLRINLWVLLFLKIFASHSVCTTVARGTSRWLLKFVDEVGSTVFNRNIVWVFATSMATTKADLPCNYTIFHCRMSSHQPAWPFCTTSVCWHTRCWHFCSCSSHQTIPSLREWTVTYLWTVRCWVTFLSIGITQVFIMMARIGYKMK